MDNQLQNQIKVIKAIELDKSLKSVICGSMLGIVALTSTNPLCNKCMEHIREYPHLDEKRFYNPERLIYFGTFGDTMFVSGGTTSFVAISSISPLASSLVTKDGKYIIIPDQNL